MAVMNYFENKVAFVTGAASGIGLALSKALTARGVKVMMADIDTDALADARADLPGSTAQVKCDVANAQSVAEAAQATLETFGKVHFVFNNAGVAMAGLPGDIKLPDWRWAVDINLMGVVYGVEAFAPILREQGEGGHIINTASMAGHVTTATLAPYNTTKFAVVAYSECLRAELQPDNINVSVLCPTFIKTNIHNSAEHRPSRDDGRDHREDPAYELTKAMVEAGMNADLFAELVLTCMANGRFYIFNDPNAKFAITERYENIIAEYDACLKDLEGLT